MVSLHNLLSVCGRDWGNIPIIALSDFGLLVVFRFLFQFLRRIEVFLFQLAQHVPIQLLLLLLALLHLLIEVSQLLFDIRAILSCQCLLQILFCLL